MKPSNTLISLVLVSVTFSLNVSCSNGKDSLTISDFKKALKNEGFTIGEKTDKLSGMMQAKKGYSFEVKGDPVEVYQYNTQIESGKEAIKKYANEGIMGKGFLRNKNLLMLKNTDHAKWEKIKKVFNSL